VAGVPATATAVYANLTVDNTAAGSIDSWLIPFATGTTPPSTTLNYHADGKSALGTTIDLNAQGQMSIKFDYAAAPVSVKVDVLGYFDGQPSNAGFTPMSARIYDSTVAAGTTVDVQVNGVAGVPAYSPSISGVTFIAQAQYSTADGSVIVWPSDDSMPGVAAVD